MLTWVSDCYVDLGACVMLVCLSCNMLTWVSVTAMLTWVSVTVMLTWVSVTVMLTLVSDCLVTC